jgi:DNA-binding transcriptional LysR family regulator
MKMELYQLRTFAAVAELGSLTQASERLHMSQPAASLQIKMLEEAFGVALFERKRSGLTLTRAGATLLPEIKKLLATASGLTVQAKRLRGQLSGTIRFATVLDASLLRLGEIMNLMVTRHPMLEIEVHHRNSRSIVRGISIGEIDVGIALGNRDIPNLRRIFLTELRYRVVAPGTWPERLRKAPWNEIASLPWISAPKNGSHYQMATDLFRKHHIEPAKVIEADSESVIASLVGAGVGLGLMREDLAMQAQDAGTVIVLDNGQPRTFLQLIHHNSRENDPAIQALLGVLRELWPDNEFHNPVKRPAEAVNISPRTARHSSKLSKHFPV